MKISSKLTLLVAVSLLAVPFSLNAQPDISGYWMISFGAVPPGRPANALEQELIDALPEDTYLLGDTGMVEYPPGEFGGLPVTEEALASTEGYDHNDQVLLSTTCSPPSIIYSMQGPFPIEVFQGRDMIVMKMEYFDVVRIIFMNETRHPDNWPHSVAGHSIGHWEEDTLVVETTRISENTFFNNGLNHSDNLKLTERFKLSDDGQTLVIAQMYEDPEVFRGTAARIIPLNKTEGEHVWPYDCDPSYGAAMENRDG